MELEHRGTWWRWRIWTRTAVVRPLGRVDARASGRGAATGLPAWHPPQHLRLLPVPCGPLGMADGSVLVNLVTSNAPLDVDGFVELIRGLWGDRVQGILHTPNDDVGERVGPGRQSQVIWGNSTVARSFTDCRLASAWPRSSRPARRSGCMPRSWPHPGGGNPTRQVIMDLFCGTGTIGQILAKHANVPVVGVDIVPQAIEDAREAATRNGIDNVTFFAADAGKFLLEHPEYKASSTLSCSTRHMPASLPRPFAKSCASRPSLVARSFLTTQARDLVGYAPGL